jgi:Leu/Phe-tRNA-protein transferase
MSTDLPLLESQHLNEEFAEKFMYPNMFEDYYIMNTWSASDYIEQAWLGMIAVSVFDSTSHIYYFLPQLQRSYAVLDFSNMQIPRKVKQIFGTKDWLEGHFSYRFTLNPLPVIQYINNEHKDCWLKGPYVEIMKELSHIQIHKHGFTLLAFELYKKEQLLAGEIGYIFGSVYTSLSGFYCKNDLNHSGLGFLQLVLLGQRLQESGASFWNLGHPHMDYKHKLGAKTVSRLDFIKRWKLARTQPLTKPLIDLHS